MSGDQEVVRLQRRSGVDPVDDEAALRRVMAEVRSGHGRLLTLAELRTILARSQLYFRPLDGLWYSDRLFENAGALERERVARILGVGEELVASFERHREGGGWRPTPRALVALFELAGRLKRLDDEVLELEGLDLAWYRQDRSREPEDEVGEEALGAEPAEAEGDE